MKSIGLGASFYDMVAVDACCELFGYAGYATQALYLIQSNST